METGEVRPSLEAVSQLVACRWSMDLTPKQRDMVAEIADHQGEGSEGYRVVIDLLAKVPSDEDPLRVLKEHDRAIRVAGLRRALAQEAESAHWRKTRGSGGIQQLGAIIEGLREGYGREIGPEDLHRLESSHYAVERCESSSNTDGSVELREPQ